MKVEFRDAIDKRDGEEPRRVFQLHSVETGEVIQGPFEDEETGREWASARNALFEKRGDPTRYEF